MLPTNNIWRTPLVLIAYGVCAALSPRLLHTAEEPDSTTIVSPVDTSVATALPGKILTVSFRVTNTDAVSRRYRDSLTLPPAWKALARTQEYALQPGESSVRLLSFRISGETEAGDYTVTYSAGDTSRTAARCVRVASLKGLKLELLEAPVHVVAGRPYLVKYLLTNTGNAASGVQLSTNERRGSIVRLDSTALWLPPRSSRLISASVYPTDLPAVKEYRIVDLHAQAAEDSSIEASRSAGVTIIPASGPDNRRAYHWYNAFAAVRAAGQDGRSRAQGELFGAGSLDAEGAHKLRFMVRSPQLQQISMLGREDEYSARYETRASAVFLGDQYYALSPLTEYGRYAFGGGGQSWFDKVLIGGFFNTQRLVPARPTEVAGFVGYRVDPGALFSLNYLGKQEAERADIISLRTTAQPFTDSQVELEYARGFSGGQQTYASLIRVSGREPWIIYDVQFIRAEPGFKGYYRDLDHMGGTVSIMPWGKLRLEAIFREEDRNVKKDPSLYAAPRDRYLQAGVGYSNLVTVYARKSTIEDRLPNPKFHRTENAFVIRGAYFADWFNILANIEAGTIEERVLHTTSPFRRFMVSGNIRPAWWQSYGLSLFLQQDRNIVTGEPIDRMSGTINARWSVLESAQAFLSVYGSTSLAGPSQDFSSIDAGIQYELPFGHLLSAEARYTWYSAAGSAKSTESAYLLEYSIPLNLPIGRREDMGRLLGKVIDQQSGGGVADILIFVGESIAISNSEGEFVVDGLRPGPQQLQVDLASLGSGRVLASSLPDTVEIPPGDDVSIMIETVHGASVAGTVVRFAAREATATAEADTASMERIGHAGVVLELSNGKQLHRRITDTHGRFEFRGVTPGKWQLTIVGGEVPSRHYFDLESVSLAVEAASSVESNFRLIPRRKPIKIIEVGRLAQESAGK